MDKIEWLESMHTLHGKVEILYVVCGYRIQRTFDDCEVGDPIEAPTLAEAIEIAMAAGWKPLTMNNINEEWK